MMARNRGARWGVAAAVGVVLAGLPASSLVAQAPERNAVVLLRGEDTLTVERWQRMPERAWGIMLVRVADTRVSYDMALNADATVATFALRVWRATMPDTVPPLQHAVMTFQGDSVELEQGGSVAWHRTSLPGAMPYLNLSAAALEQLVHRARASGGGTIPLVLATGTPVDARVTLLDRDSVVVAMAGVELRLAVDSAGRFLGGTVPAQGVRWVPAPGATIGVAAPVDYSAPADAPYTAESVMVTGPAGPLAGTLTLPRRRAGRVPAVVTITGSGAQERDESLGSTVPGYRPFRQVADTLGRRGIAVLRMDDRGYGESGGSFAGATSQDFARDIEAGVAYLRGRPEIDPNRIALVGHSEGGIIAPMVAVADPRIRAIVLLAGTAYTGRRVLEYQVRYALRRDSALAGARLQSAVARAMSQITTAARTNPWIAEFLQYDPLTMAARVRVPVLILQGGTDRQVTPDQAPLLARTMRAGGDRDVTVDVFPDRDHLFLRDASGNPGGYAHLPSKRIDTEVMGTLADWLVARLGAAPETSRRARQ